MMTIDEMRERMRVLGYSYKKLSELSGVPLSTIQKVLGKVTKSPRYDTLQAIERALGPFYTDSGEKQLSDPAPARRNRYQEWREAHPWSDVLREDPAVYRYNTYEPDPDIPDKKPGEYTIDDYLSLPDDRRVELIDGYFYDMTGPTYTHQLIVGQIHFQLLSQAEKHTCPCYPFISPADVQLDCNEWTVVQPDVLVVCDLSKIQHGRYFGAPEFVVEVLSPSTRNKDMFLKGGKYQRGGVKEFWMVDPRGERVTVYDFRETDTRITIYGFDDKVPVLISDGSCRVDFARIKKMLEEMFPDREQRNP